MEKIKKTLEGIYTVPSLRKSCVPLFIGNPGLGKTVIIEQFAKEQGAKLVQFITSQRNPFEISGMAMPDSEIKKMTIWDFDQMLSLNDGDILFFDEVLNGNPTVLNACLTLIEQRVMISGKKLPDIMIVAAANPQGMVPLTPQIKERFIWYTVNFNQDMWKTFMFNKYSVSYGIVTRLVSLIKSEEFLHNNFYSPRSVDKAVDMVIHGVPTPYEDVIKPILTEMIENPFEEPIALVSGKELNPSEMIQWLDLIRFSKNITIKEIILPTK